MTERGHGGDTLSELEQSLATSWSLDTLAVYADHLQQRGDPRGELMALDLNPAPDSKAWRAQRQALLVAWLGEALAERAGHLVQHGFLHAFREDRFHPPDLLDGPLGALVRNATLSVHERDLVRFASRPRPWLVGLTLMNHSPVAYSDATRAALIAAAPNLQELLLLGRPAFNAFPHPTVRRVYVERGSRVAHHHYPVDVLEGAEVRDLFPSLDGRGPSLLRDELDLALDAVAETPDLGQLQAQYGALFTDGDSLPALLLRLRAAGLVHLEGPTARVTTAGRVLRHKEPLRPVRARVPKVDTNKWVLWADVGPQEEAYILGLLSHHARLAEGFLALAPLNPDVQDVLVAWRHFLRELECADERARLEFDAPARLAQAVDTLLELWDLLGRELPWSGMEHSDLKNLREVLGSSLAPNRVRFNLVWGM